MHEETAFPATADGQEVSALLEMPSGAGALLVFAHGAGAGMRHGFMNGMSARLAARGVATLRYQFPYTEQGRNRPDTQPVLLATVRSAVAYARERASGIPVFAGGKSMGGRMTSLADAEAPLGVAGIIFFGFPLHPSGRPGRERSEHLARVSAPMLFLQGTRDTLADLTLLEPVIESLGARATLHVVDTADHGFHVLKRSGLTDAEALDALAERVATWCRDVAH
jgi:predicted alpha/beta-hydrolase family hydrolase